MTIANVSDLRTIEFPNFLPEIDWIGRGMPVLDIAHSACKKYACAIQSCLKRNDYQEVRKRGRKRICCEATIVFCAILDAVLIFFAYEGAPSPPAKPPIPLLIVGPVRPRDRGSASVLQDL